MILLGLLEDTTMTRRSIGFLMTLALAILVAPLAAEAQPLAKIPRIGVLSAGPPGGSDPAAIEAFWQGLRDLGYVEGQTIVIEYRWAEGREERLLPLAAELVGLPVDCIVAGTTRAVQAAQRATRTIPIVIAVSADPVASGFVASLARPGGNITGLSLMAPEVGGKRLEWLRDIRPGVSRVAVLWNPAQPGSGIELQGLEGAAQALGLQLYPLEVRTPDEFESAFTAMHREGADALLVLRDPLLLDRHHRDIAALALQHQLPAMYGWRAFVEAGGLMSYGPRVSDLFRRAAYYVDRIVKGTKPADLPVEQPTQFELVLNLKTAEALGLTMPPHLLVLADEVLR
jgi:putative ABC transport system substrate-binding protein